MREDKRFLLEVHVAGICIDGNSVLVVKRSAFRRLYPNLWECGGGQVKEGENFEDAIKRQLYEELGVIVEPIMLFGTYEILTPHLNQLKIPGLKFVCKIKSYVNGVSPAISNEHSEWRWQLLDNLDELEFIPGLKEEILEAYNLLNLK